VLPEIRQSLPRTGTRKASDLSGSQERVPVRQGGIAEHEVSATCRLSQTRSELFSASVTTSMITTSTTNY
jgi:hypothetical protein